MFPSRYIRSALHNHGSSAEIEKIKNPLIRRACVLVRSSTWCLTHFRFFISHDKYFPRFEILLAKSCPFNCKCCIHFLPDSSADLCESAEEVIANMDRILSAIELIDEIYISGGDAFLYPRLSTIVKYLLTSEKIGKVIIISTAAVPPKEEVLKLFPNDKLILKVENYGKYSSCIEEFTSLSIPGIQVGEVEKVWENFGNEACRNRSSRELHNQYEACKKERYCLLGGKIYACPRSAHGEELGFFQNSVEGECIDLKSVSDYKDLLNKIRKLRKVSHLTACNHCDSCTESFGIYGLEKRFKN